MHPILDNILSAMRISQPDNTLRLSEEEACTLLLLFGGVSVLVSVVALFVFHAISSLVGSICDYVDDVFTPEKRKVVSKREVRMITKVASDIVCDLEKQVKMLTTQANAYSKTIENLLARERDRADFEKKVIEWAKN